MPEQEEDTFVNLSAEAKGSKGHKSPRPSTEIQPVELSAILRKKVALLAESLFEKRHERRKLMGGAPYKGDPVSKEERKTQYQELKGSRALLLNAIADNSTVGAGGELRVSKKLLESFVELGGN